MKTHAILIAAAVSFLPLSQAGAQMDHGAMQHEPTSGASGEYMDAMKSMDTAMKAMTMTGQAAPDFAAMMIPHHQAAIDMAKSYLKSGDNDPELEKLSNDIIAAQEREIAFLKSWLARHGQ